MARLSRKFNATLIPIAVSVLLFSWHVPGWSEDGTQITGIQLTPAGEIVLQVSGEGFDPLFQVRPLPDGQYQITISGKHVTLGNVRDERLDEAFQREIPAIQDSLLSGTSNGFQLNLTSWQRLLPQIQSNSGDKIVIALIGNHQVPPEVIARQKQAAEQALLAEAKRKADELAKQKAEAEKAALEKKRMEEDAARQKAAAEAAQQAVIKKRQAEESARKQAAEAALKQEKAREAAQRLAEVKAREKQWVPSVSPGGKPIDTDWQNAYRSEPVALNATEETLPKQQTASHYNLAFPRALTLPFTPDTLAKDRIPNPVLSEGSEPFAPLRLQKTPSGYDPDSALAKSEAPEIEFYSEYAASTDPVIQRIRGYLRNGETDRAELELRARLGQKPDDVEGRYLLALILEQSARKASPKGGDQTQLENARLELVRITNQRPFLPASLKLADLYLDENNLVEAKRILDQVTPLYSGDAQVWFLRGRLSEAENNVSEAKTAYLNALAIQPRQSEVHYRLAQVYLKSENWNACRWELLRALAISPDDARCWKLLGYLAEKQGQPEQAIQWYQASLQPDVMIHYGRLLEKRDQAKEALAVYQAVESIAGEDLDLLFNLGMIYVDADQARRAEAVLKRFIKLNANPSDTRITQAKNVLKQLNR